MDPHNGQLPVGLITQPVEHGTLSPVQAFFSQLGGSFALKLDSHLEFFLDLNPESS